MKGRGIKELEHLKPLSLKIQEATSKSVAISENLVSLRNKWYGWAPVKYMNVLHLNRTQKQLRDFFLNKLQKYCPLSSGTLDISGQFHKNDDVNL